MAIPTPWTGTLLGWSGQWTFDVYGNDYFAYKGATAGRSATVVSASVVGGWVDPAGRATVGRGRLREGDLRTFLSGDAYTVGGGYWGGYQRTWNNAGRANEFGIVTPQFGGAWHNSVLVPLLPSPSELSPMVDW